MEDIDRFFVDGANVAGFGLVGFDPTEREAVCSADVGSSRIDTAEALLA